MATSSGIGCMLVLTLWGFGGRYGVAMLVPFAVLFGVASGGFTSMWSQSAVQIVGHDKEQQILLVSGEKSRFILGNRAVSDDHPLPPSAFSLARGLGAVIGPTIGSALYHETPPDHHRWGSAGSPGLVALVAGSMACSAAVGILFAYSGVMRSMVQHVALRWSAASRQEPGANVEMIEMTTKEDEAQKDREAVI